MADIVEEHSRLLERLPNLGRQTNDANGLQLVISGTPFIAFYEVVDERVRILRFFHGAQLFRRK